jgi:hypothetical protein
LNDLQDQAIIRLGEQASPAGVLLPETLRIATIYEQILLPQPGQAGSQMAAYGRVAFEADYVRLMPLQRRLEAALALPSGWAIDWEAIYGVAHLEPEQEHVTLDLKAPVQPQPAASDVIRLVQGRTLEQAQRLLQTAFPLLQPAHIEIWPDFWPRLPLWPARIQVSY